VYEGVWPVTSYGFMSSIHAHKNCNGRHHYRNLICNNCNVCSYITLTLHSVLNLYVLNMYFQSEFLYTQISLKIVHLSQNMQEIVYCKLIQFKYQSAVSAVCLSCMMVIIFNEWDMNTVVLPYMRFQLSAFWKKIGKLEK
jgi:hypothetical protein